MDPVAVAFEPVLGHPSWLVRRGHGAFLTLEFGRPDLSIGEPRLASTHVEGLPRATMRRAVVHGAWHLWIATCAWSLSVAGTELIGVDSDDVTIDRGLRVLNGQALQRVDVSAVDGRSRFTFDLGGVLATWPWPETAAGASPAEQWLLYQPSGRVLTVRSDGSYAETTETDPEDETSWQPLPAG